VRGGAKSGRSANRTDNSEARVVVITTGDSMESFASIFCIGLVMFYLLLLILLVWALLSDAKARKSSG
jgi:hypothetical protein